jgi:hypothetical protein
MAGKQGKAPGDSFAEAVKLFNLGVDGDKEAVQRAHGIFKEIWSQNPDNHLVEAYLGSTTALLGRDHPNLNEKFRLAIEGLKLLDSAVAKEPKNTEIRILRGHVCFNLPDMYFHRLTTAVEDFEFLISCYQRNKKLFSRDFYLKTLFDLGSAYKQMGRKKEADAAWEKILLLTREPKYLNLLRQEGFSIPKWVAASKQKPGNYMSPEKLKQLEEARAMHRRAVAGDKEEVAGALAYFEKALKENPADNLIKAYHADCLSMAGRNSEDHSLLFGNAIKALIDFDKAVNGDPHNIEIRLLRANHSYRLPEVFFRRAATAMGDYEYLIGCYEKDNSIFDGQTYIEILDKLGEVYERLEMNDEAKSVWTKLHESTADEKYLLKQRPEDTGFNPEKAKGMNWQQALQEGIRLHNLAVKGNKKAAGIAKALLEGVYKARPGNSLAKGYYGSSLALTGWYSANPGDMFGKGIKGFKLVKEAVERDPGNFRLRILRGYLAYNLPENFFHMTALAIEDFKFLIQAYDKDNSIFSKEFYWQVHYDLGMAYRRIGETERARRVWTDLARKSKDPKYAKAAEDE